MKEKNRKKEVRGFGGHLLTWGKYLLVVARLIYLFSGFYRIKPFETGNKIRIPLLGTGTFEQTKKVNVLYQSRRKKLHGTAKIDQQLPLANAPILRSTWAVYYPPEYHPVHSDSDFSHSYHKGPVSEVLSRSLYAQIGNVVSSIFFRSSL